jgi:hypothetical protein
MKFILALLISLSSITANATFAMSAFRCTNKYGVTSWGKGRYSRDGEYSNYWSLVAKEGQFVIFKYPYKYKEYWFRSESCTKQ